jgi:chaperonin cofactor prefoldin
MFIKLPNNLSCVTTEYNELIAKYDDLHAKCDKLQIEKKNVEENLKEVIEESDNGSETISELRDQNLSQGEPIQVLTTHAYSDKS